MSSAPLVVTRRCGLPVAVLDLLRAPETLQLIRDAVALEAFAGRLGTEISEDLYRLVPTLSDRAVRRSVLRLRRDVHNQRWSPEVDSTAAAVLPHVGVAAADRLTRWLSAMRGSADHFAKAAEVSDGELAAAGRAMLSLLRAPRTALGLALASPAFTANLLARETTAEWDSRLARSAAAYLSRVAMKPSPFGTLTTVGVTGWAAPPTRHEASLARSPRQDGTVPNDDGTTALSSSRAAAMELLRAWAMRPDAPDALPLVGNPSVRDLDGRALAALPLYCQANGVFLREDELTECGPAAAQLSRLGGQPRPAAKIAALLGIDRASVGRLVATGVLQPVTPWRLDDGRHFTAFARQVAAVQGPAADAVRTLALLEQRVATSTDPRQRAADVERARGVLREAFCALDQRPPDWLRSVGLMHEVAAHAEDTSPSAAVRADLDALTALLRPRVRRVALYDYLVEQFVRRHGTGGTADLLTFCYELLSTGPSPWWEVKLGQTPSDQAAPLAGDRTLGRAANTVFFQVAGDQLVVNRMHSGLAGLVGRWACVPALHDPLDETLRDWLAGLHPGCRVYQMSTHADWVEFQRPALRGLPRVGWGADLADRAAASPSGPGLDHAAADLRGFTLAHDPASGTLQVTDPAGQPAAFAYLGAVPARLLRGVDRLLVTLSDPWMIVPDRPADMPYRPREQHGRIVLRRATWRMAPADVPRPDRGRPPVDFLADVERWRRRHQLPDEVFLTCVPKQPWAYPSKPQWIGFGHPHAVWAALRQIDDNAGAVEVVEALPGSEHAPVVTELTGLVRHD